jgi:transposase
MAPVVVPNVEDLLRVIARQQATIEQLIARVKELEAQVGQNSGNSHRPPSSDIAPPPKPARDKSGKKKGGQPGHEGKTRPLMPAERVDTFVPCMPAECRGCGHSLAGVPVEVEPTRHQVTELPELRATVTEYQLHWLTCPGCRTATRGELPSGMRPLAFGPRMIALVTLLLGRHLGSHRRVCELISDLTDVEIGLGSITNMNAVATQALASPYQEIMATVRRSLVVYADETSWRDQQEGKPWMWVAVCTAAVLFRVHPTRSRAGKTELLGDFSGTLVSDRFAAYYDHPVEDRQVCHAHLKRDFKGLVGQGGECARFGKELRALQKDLFALYRRREAGTLTLAEAREALVPEQERWRGCLERGLSAKHEKVYALCLSLLKLFPAIFVFVEDLGVKGVNNDAEQELRPAVIKRKVSNGSGSDAGCRFIERVLSVISTCRRQGRNAFTFLVSACEAAITRMPAPKLLQTT